MGRAITVAILGSVVFTACDESPTDPSPRAVALAGIVQDSQSRPVAGAHVWARAWSLSNPGVGGAWQGAVVTDSAGMFLASLGIFGGSSLDSIEIHTLPPGCPRQDPKQEVLQQAAIHGDVAGTVNTTVTVPPVARPQSPMTNALCAVGIAERFGYYDFIGAHKFELRLDSLLPGGSSFGRWIVTGSTRPVMAGPATGVLTTSFVGIDLLDSIPASPCLPFRLQGTIEPTGYWGPLQADAGAACGLRATYDFVDWTGQPSDLP